jgi:ribosomal protein L12E/L44/L45/RPP1/RPP2
MKLKYYMRGLGIGILLTTTVLAIAKPKEELTDQEVIKRAEALGMELKSDRDNVLGEMLENSKLTEAPTQMPEKPSPEPTAALTPSEEPTLAPELTVTPEPTKEPSPAPEPSKEPEPTAAPGDTKEEENQERDGVNSGELIVFTVEKGMSSGEVATLLEKVGLIQDSDDFNKYIVKKGKASVIGIGTYTLPIGVTYDEIIAQITM